MFGCAQGLYVVTDMYPIHRQASYVGVFSFRDDILTLGTFLLFQRRSAPPAFYRIAFGSYSLGRLLRA